MNDVIREIFMGVAVMLLAILGALNTHILRQHIEHCNKCLEEDIINEEE